MFRVNTLVHRHTHIQTISTSLLSACLSPFFIMWNFILLRGGVVLLISCLPIHIQFSEKKKKFNFWRHIKHSKICVYVQISKWFDHRLFTQALSRCQNSQFYWSIHKHNYLSKALKFLNFKMILQFHWLSLQAENL